jgi:hypothetical protein
MKTLFKIILISLFLISCQPNTVNKSESLQFEIVEKQDISFLNNPRMVNRIILKVDSLPSKQEMENTATLIWKNGNKSWKEFTVFIYLIEMNTEQSAYGIGEFNESGLVKFEINESALYGSKWAIKKIDEPIEQVLAAELKEYSVKISTVKEDKRKVKIIVNTNFPDGTNLLLSIGRIHFLKSKKEAYSGDIFNNNFSVEQGKIETTVEIKDSEWYNEHQRLVKDLPNDISPISKISDNITIDVLYTSAANQPANVIKILGAKGEFVAGNGVEKNEGGTIGLLTTLRVSKELNMPFQK